MELNKTIQHYFHQPSLETVSVAELEKAVERFPYSAALQFLLLKKMQLEKNVGFETQFGKTSLFYSNPWLLQDILQASPRLAKSHATQVSEPSVTETVPGQPVSAELETSTIGAGEESVPAEQTELAEQTVSVVHSAHEEQPVPAEQFVPAEQELTVYQATATTEQPAVEPVFDEPTTIPEPEEILPAKEHLSQAEPSQALPTEEVQLPNGGLLTEEESSELRTELLMKESPIRIPSLKDLSPQTDEMPLFEPYHTIDYFASQGIKLSQELPVNDKLGRQMKSFTEWIRTMKKLPQSQIERQLLVAATGENIVAMAAGSVKMEEVITETMAEVLAKQGNIAKAIDLYNKLSLAHPDKSAYFATRIEQLKHS